MTQALPLPAHLYHVTPALNALGIRIYGIDPRRRFPERVIQRSWFVNEESVMWAIAHCSARHGLPTSQLVVFHIDDLEIVTSKAIVKRHGRPAGLFHTDYIGLCKNTGFMSAEFAMHLWTEGVTLASSSVWTDILPF